MTENQITSLTSQTANEHLTIINEKEVYSFTKHEKKDGQEKATTVVIANQYAVARLSNIDAIINLNKNSNVALSIELARLKKSVAEENGFKTVAQMVHSIHDDLSETTINAYRRVGIVFGDLASEVFKWKDLIPQNVSITNLVQVVGLVDIDKDTDKITQDDAVKAVSEFVDKYILSDRLHLLLPLSKLKEEIKDINNTVDSTAKDITEEPQKTEPQKSEPQKSEPQKSEPQKTEPQKTEPQKSEEPRKYVLDLTDDIRQKLYEYAVSILEVSDIKPLKSPSYRKERQTLIDIAKYLTEYNELLELSDNEPS